MARILLLGYNPPALEKDSKIEAAHYRTWQFLEPLMNDGHEICLCANSPANSNPSLPDAWSRQLVYHSLPLFRTVGWVHQLQKIHDIFQPDCIVAVNFDCCLGATKLRTAKPIWMDIYGDPLTIMQVARYRAGSDRGIQTSINFLRQVLQKGDVYSVCGTPQQHALVGELAMSGRLNSRTLGYQFATVVLPGASSVVSPNVTRPERSHLSNLGVGKDGFVVLWCGGYNTWTDVETLFSGLEWAMEQDLNIHYLSVGANTYEAPDNVYNRFLQMIEQSKYRDRFHMLGWQSWREVAKYYDQSDVGISIDALHYETIYGTRTRLVEMIAAGLPVITSLGCELSDLLRINGAGLTFKTGDWRGLAEQIITLANDRDLCRRMAEAAQNYARNDLSFAVTTASLRAWVQKGKLAPDRERTNMLSPFQSLEYKARSAVRQFLWKVTGLAG